MTNVVIVFCDYKLLVPFTIAVMNDVMVITFAQIDKILDLFE
jgi:hypothetical protein